MGAQSRRLIEPGTSSVPFMETCPVFPLMLMGRFFFLTRARSSPHKILKEDVVGGGVVRRAYGGRSRSSPRRKKDCITLVRSSGSYYVVCILLTWFKRY